MTLPWLSMAVALFMASILLWAGLEKARNLQGVSSTFTALGFAGWMAKPFAALLAITELSVALGLLFSPDSAATQGGVVILAGGFAVAGAIALKRKRLIRCNCFGAGSSSYLGKKQMIALLPWLGAVGLVRLGVPESQPVFNGATYFAVAALTISFLRAPAVYKAWQEARGDRLSAMETYGWQQ